VRPHKAGLVRAVADGGLLLVQSRRADRKTASFKSATLPVVHGRAVMELAKGNERGGCIVLICPLAGTVVSNKVSSRHLDTPSTVVFRKVGEDVFGFGVKVLTKAVNTPENMLRSGHNPIRKNMITNASLV
jgi:hypothetical protein